MSLCSGGRSNVVLMLVGMPNVVGSTVLIVVLKSIHGVALDPAIEPRMSLWSAEPDVRAELEACAPVTQLRLSTNCQV